MRLAVSSITVTGTWVKRNSAARWVVDEASLRQHSLRTHVTQKQSGRWCLPYSHCGLDHIFQEISEGNNKEIQLVASARNRNITRALIQNRKWVVLIQICEFHSNMLERICTIFQCKSAWEVSMFSTCADGRCGCRVCFRKSNVIMKQGSNRFVHSGDNTGIAQ